MAALTVDFRKHSRPTPADDTSAQIITDCGNFTLDLNQHGFCASPLFLQTLGPRFPNEMQNLLPSEKRTLDHWVTVQFFFSLAQVRCFWRCFCFRSCEPRKRGSQHRPYREAPEAAAEEVSPLPLSVADVTRSFKRVNIRKAVGPDGIPGRVLRACAFQLAWVFTDILNIYRSLFVVPRMLQKIHHCAHTKEKYNHMLKWLEAHCSDTHLQ